jgi:hypothetical protein
MGANERGAGWGGDTLFARLGEKSLSPLWGLSVYLYWYALG